MTYKCKPVKPSANNNIRTSVSAVEVSRKSDADTTGSKAGIAAA
jgi:hypothetical protein